MDAQEAAAERYDAMVDEMLYEALRGEEPTEANVTEAIATGYLPAEIGERVLAGFADTGLPF